MQVQRAAFESRLAAIGAAASIVLLLGCQTQRWPGPMEPEVEPLPPGKRQGYVPGPEEVDVIRYGDPVMIRRAGQTASFPMTYYAGEDRERVNSGAWVMTGSGGKAELFWPSDGTSIILEGECIVFVGEPSRDEPTATFYKIDRARLSLTPEDRIAIMGGAIVRGDPVDFSGPYDLQTLRGGETVRFQNRSGSAGKAATVEFREEFLSVNPSQLADLPVLDSKSFGGIGSAPVARPAGFEVFDADGFRASLLGESEAERIPGGLVVRAGGVSEMRALGVRVFLENGERAIIRGLGKLPESGPPEPAPDPAPGPGPDAGSDQIATEPR